MEEINIKDFLDYIREKFLVVIISVLAALLVVLIYDAFIKTDKYSTYTTIALVSENGVTQSDLSINKNLVGTYTEIIKSKKVLKQVIDQLYLDYSVSKLSSEITVSSGDNADLIKITVEDESATTASYITKAVSDIFTKEVASVYKLNNIAVIDEPEISTTVSNDTFKRDLLLALAVGIFGSIGVLFVVYYFDDTIKLNDNIEEDLGLPVIAKVFKSRVNSGKKNNQSAELILSKYPKSVVSESIKALRTNLQFSSVDKQLKTILITSSIPGEGKSFISSNLAISFAQSEERVLLIDADMRKGRLHRVFKLSNANGYSNLLLDDVSNFMDYVKKTSIPGLSVITRGTIPPNPSELLDSYKNKELIKELKKYYDKIIFDGVPCSGLTDSIIMSKNVDEVVIVSSNKYTPRSEFINTRNSLQKMQAPIAGVIINKIDSNRGTYSKYYQYYGDKE